MAYEDFELFRPAGGAYRKTPGAYETELKSSALGKSAYLAEMDKFYSALDEQMREFDVSLKWEKEKFGKTLGLEERKVSIGEKQYGQTLAEEKRQFNETLGFSKGQFSQALEWEKEKFGEGMAWESEKFWGEYALAQKQFNKEYGLKGDIQSHQEVMDWLNFGGNLLGSGINIYQDIQQDNWLKDFLGGGGNDSYISQDTFDKLWW